MNDILNIYNDKSKYRPISGYEGKYYVSKYGDIISVSSRSVRLLKQTPRSDGYVMVGLCKNNKSKHFYVHRIIAEAFLDRDEIRNCVNHINGIRSDNRLSNLEWVTYKENIGHAYSSKRFNKNRDDIFFDKTKNEYCFYVLHEGFKSLEEAKKEKEKIESTLI